MENKEIKNIKLDNNELPKSNNHIGNVFFNGFHIRVSATDASIVIISGGEEVGNLILPFGTLKSLAEAATQNIKILEKELGPIYSIGEARQKINKQIKQDEK